MPDQRAEVGYRVTVQGTGELKDLARAQREVRQSTIEANELLKANDASLRGAAIGSELYAKQQDGIRQKQFKQGASYDPELIEEARIKSVAQAHRELDAQIERGQLRQLSGLERITVEHKKALAELSSLNDPALIDKANQLFSQRRTTAIQAEQEAAIAARLKAADAARKEAATLAGSRFGFNDIRQLSVSPSTGLARLGDDAGASFTKAGLAVAGITLALTLATAAAVNLVQESGKIAEGISNTADRLGLKTTDVLKLSAAAGIAGVNIESLEGAARTLGAALEDPAGSGKKAAAELNKLGIDAYDSTGHLREMGPVLLDVLTALSKIPETSARINASRLLLPRGAANELQPLIKDLPNLQKAVQDLGIGLDNDLIPKLAAGDDEFDKLREAVKNLKLELSKEIAPFIIPIIIKLKDSISGGANRTNDQVLADEANRIAPRIGRYIEGLLGQGSADDDLELSPEELAGARFPKTGGKPPGPGVTTQQLSNRYAAENYRATRGQNIEGLEEDKRDAQKRLKDADAKLSQDSFPVANRPEQEGIRRQATVELDRIEASIKDLRKREGEYDRLKTEVEGIEKRSHEFELSGLQKINQERDEEIKKIKEAKVARGEESNKPALIARVNESFDLEARKETNRQEAARLREELSLRQQIIGLELGPGKEVESIHARAAAARETANAAFAIENRVPGAGNVDARDKAVHAANTSEDAEITIYKIKNRLADEENERALQRLAIEQQLAQAEKRVQFNPSGTFDVADQEQRALKIRELRKASIEAEYQLDLKGEDANLAARKRQLAIAHEQGEYDAALLAIREAGEEKVLHLREQAIETKANRQTRLVELSTNGDEFANIDKVRNIRIQAAQELFKLTNDQDARQREIDQAEFDRVVSIIELRKKEIEDFKKEAGGIFDALTANGARGLSTFVAGFLKTIEKQIFENLSGLAFESVRKSLPKVGGQVDEQGNKTTLGKILEHTPLAQGASEDQLKAAQAAATAATGVNSTATNDNTRAIIALTAALQAARAAAGPQLPAGGGVEGIAGVVGAADQATAASQTLEEPSISATELAQQLGSGQLEPGSAPEAIVSEVTSKLGGTEGEGLSGKGGPDFAAIAAAGIPVKLVGADYTKLAQQLQESDPAATVGGISSATRAAGIAAGESSSLGGDGISSGGGLGPDFGASDSTSQGAQASAKGGGLGGAISAATAGIGKFATLMANPFGDKGGTPGKQIGTDDNGDPVYGAGKDNGHVSAAGVAAAGVDVFVGATTAISEFKKGGARGALGGISSVLGTAAALDPEPISKTILGVAAAVTGIAKSLLGDPKAERAKALQQEVQDNAYHEKKGVNIVEDSRTGNQVDQDFLGHIRNLGVKPSTQDFTQALGFGVPALPNFLQGLGIERPTLPGLLTDSQQRLATPNPSAYASQAPASGTTIHINPQINITSFDSKDVLAHAGPISDAVTSALQSGHRLRGDIQRVVRP